MESNIPVKEGYEYGYVMFEQLTDIYVDSREHEPVPFVDMSNLDAPIMMLKLINDKKVSSEH